MLLRILLCLALPVLGHADFPREPGELLILFKDNSSKGSQKSDFHGELHTRLSTTLVQRLEALGLDRVRLPVGADESKVIQAYLQSGLVVSAEPNWRVSKSSPNDTLYTAGLLPWYDQIGATAAFNAWQGGSIALNTQVIVAVLDTGISAHADLASQLLPGVSTVSYTTSYSDDEGHGTFVAGIIAASVSNAAGTAGVFFNSAKIGVIPVKTLNASGFGTDFEFSSALVSASDMGAKVINLSLGQNVKSEAMRTAVNYALNAGVIVVAAAGNGYGAEVSYPAAFPNVIAVGALDNSGARADYSNFGRLDLSAPGGELAFSPAAACTASPAGQMARIWSLCLLSGNTYTYDVGTSYSAPMVTAAVALLLSQNPTRTREDVYRILTQSADPTIYGAGYHAESGWGRLNVYKALTYQGGPAPVFGVNLKCYSWPNPFNPDKEGRVNLTFFLESAAACVLRVRDGAGDLVWERRLEASQTQQGMNIVTWDGHNEYGRTASNGVYLFSVESGSLRGTNRIAVLK